MQIPTYTDVKDAYARIKDVAHHTPVMTSRTLNNLTQAEVFVKCENFQRIGAFKFRGAYNAISLLTPEEKERGVITHSSGNHAQAVALAAALHHVKATIVMPENAPKVKVAATKGYGANVVFCGTKPEDRVKTTQTLIEQHNFTLIHPYDDNRVIAGAGTATLELLHDVKNIDVIFCQIGGGGLISGTAIAAKGINPDIEIIGVEPEKADDAFRSFKSKTLHPSVNPQTIADGLRTSLSERTFKIISENVADIITVSEKEILDAMKFYWERMKLVVEPSGAVSLAGILSKKVAIKGKRVAAIISGGNIDLNDFFTRLYKKIG